MKKLYIIIILCSSCNVRMHHKPNYRNSIKNIEVMEKWLNYDVSQGHLSENVANNYFYILEITKNGLIKEKKQRNDK